MSGDYLDRIEEEIDFGYHRQKKDNTFWLVLLAIVIFGLIMSMMTSCSTVQSVDWNRVITQVKFYYDQIPPETIDQLKDALKNIK